MRTGGYGRFRGEWVNTVKYGRKHSLRYYGSFLGSKLTKELRAEDSLGRFKTKIRRTDLTALIEVGRRNCMLCNKPYVT